MLQLRLKHTSLHEPRKHKGLVERVEHAIAREVGSCKEKGRAGEEYRSATG